MTAAARYFVRSADGRSSASYETPEAAERAAMGMGDGAHVVDTRAPAYVPMIQQVIDGQLRILGVGGWGAERLSLQQNFLQAIKRKQLALVHAFLAAGASPDTRDEQGRPAIIWAVASGREEIVRFLIEHGADAAAADNDGLTALALATRRGSDRIAAILEGSTNIG